MSSTSPHCFVRRRSSNRPPSKLRSLVDGVDKRSRSMDDDDSKLDGTLDDMREVEPRPFRPVVTASARLADIVRKDCHARRSLSPLMMAAAIEAAKEAAATVTAGNAAAAVMEEATPIIGGDATRDAVMAEAEAVEVA